MALTVEDKVYIDHVVGAYHEAVRGDIRLVLEALKGRPTEERVREIAREESRYLIREDFNAYIVPNIKEAVRAEVAPFRKEVQEEMRGLKTEMVALRKDSNRHDREIKALKLKRV